MERDVAARNMLRIAALAFALGLALSAIAAMLDVAIYATVRDAIADDPSGLANHDAERRVASLDAVRDALRMIGLAPILVGGIGLVVAGVWGWNDALARRALVGMHVALLAIVVLQPLLPAIRHATGRPTMLPGEHEALLALVGVGLALALSAHRGAFALACGGIGALAYRAWVASGLLRAPDWSAMAHIQSQLVLFAAIAWSLFAAAFALVAIRGVEGARPPTSRPAPAG